MAHSGFFRLIIALGLFATTSTADAAGGRSAILGAGVNTCGSWAVERKKQSGGDVTNLTWVLGYLTAQDEDAAAHRKPTLLDNIDASAIELWIDNYCQSNPLDTIYRASARLGEELRRRAESDRRQPSR